MAGSQSADLLITAAVIDTGWRGQRLENKTNNIGRFPTNSAVKIIKNAVTHHGSESAETVLWTGDNLWTRSNGACLPLFSWFMLFLQPMFKPKLFFQMSRLMTDYATPPDLPVLLTDRKNNAGNLKHFHRRIESQLVFPRSSGSPPLGCK